MIRTLIKVDKSCLHYLINLQNVFILQFMGQKSKLELLMGRFRKKESGENQCSGVSYTPRRDS